jgi:hypothetical protein
MQGSIPILCSSAPLCRAGMVLQQPALPRFLQQQRCTPVAAHSTPPAARYSAAPWPAQKASLQCQKLHTQSQHQLQRRTAVSAAAATEQVVDSTAEFEQLRSKLQLHNSMSRKKEHFTPRPEMGNKVQMYVCGVTVYDYSHIGRALQQRGNATAQSGALAAGRQCRPHDSARV